MVILGHGSFTFEDLNGNLFLIVLISGENLGFLGGENASSADNVAHDTSDSLDTKRKRSSVNKNQIIAERIFTADDTTLDGSTESDGFIGINTSVQFLAEEILNEFSDLGNSCGTTDEDDFIDVRLLQTRVFKSSLDWSDGLLEKISVEFFEFSSSEFFIEVQTFNQIFNFNLSGHGSGKVSLGIFNFTL